jgi:hypothetical protein
MHAFSTVDVIGKGEGPVDPIRSPFAPTAMRCNSPGRV